MTGTDPTRELGRGRLDAFVRWGLFILVLVGFGLAVGERWSQVWASLRAVPPLTVLAALVFGTVGLVGPWRAWDVVVADLGTRLAWRASARSSSSASSASTSPGRSGRSCYRCGWAGQLAWGAPGLPCRSWSLSSSGWPRGWLSECLRRRRSSTMGRRRLGLLVPASPAVAGLHPEYSSRRGAAPAGHAPTSGRTAPARRRRPPRGRGHLLVLGGRRHAALGCSSLSSGGTHLVSLPPVSAPWPWASASGPACVPAGRSRPPRGGTCGWTELGAVLAGRRRSSPPLPRGLDPR